MGAVNPLTGQFEALMMPYSDSITFQYFLDYFKISLSNTYCIMFLDNAGWHKSKKLDWGNIIPIYLHPYSPNLNAIEPLWKILEDRLPVLKAIKNEENYRTFYVNI